MFMAVYRFKTNLNSARLNRMSAERQNNNLKAGQNHYSWHEKLL